MRGNLQGFDRDARLLPDPGCTEHIRLASIPFGKLGCVRGVQELAGNKVELRFAFTITSCIKKDVITERLRQLAISHGFAELVLIEEDWKREYMTEAMAT